MAAHSDTLIMEPDDGRRLAERRIGVRRKAFRIAAECELLINELLLSEQRNWSDAFGSVLGSARRLIALTAPESPSMFGADMRPNSRLSEMQGDILSTINAINAAAVSSGTEGLALRGVNVIRELALGLFAPSDEARREYHDPVVADPEPATSKRASVLVADDDPSIARFLQRSLESWGLEVKTAPDGRDALAMIASHAFDLVLTDIEMPHLDGVGLLTAIKSNPETRHLPVIVVSSLDHMDIVSKCIELGAEDHISKPVAVQLLGSRVKATLERKRLHDSETEGLRRIERLIAAAEAVERDAYSPDTLAGMRAAQDGLGHLARVFDRMVSGMRTREDRLRVRVERLRAEVREGRAPNRAASGPVSEDSPFAVGDIVAGRFEIVGMLGEGGMGTVYHARDAQLNEDVALKIVRRELVEDEKNSLERLKSEIRLARKISHRNVVRAHDIGEYLGRYFITMEKVSGVTVSELLDRKGRLTVESTIAIGTQLCDALAVAHDNEIIHRDIKPPNLLIDEAGTLKVMDFGIARRMTAATGTHTRDGLLVGTPHYMAPELLMGSKPNVQTDLFAVGVVLYECLTGRQPHHGENPIELYASILDGLAPRVSQIATDVPPQLDALIHQQLRFDAATRSPSARDLGQRLSELDPTKPA